MGHTTRLAIQKGKQQKQFPLDQGNPAIHFLVADPDTKENEILKNRIKELEAQLKVQQFAVQQQVLAAANKAGVNERRRLGQELHDNINQILVCANLYFSQLNPVEGEQDLKKKGNELMLMAIEEIRNLSRHLVQPVINRNSLQENLRTLIDSFENASGIPVNFIVELEQRVPGINKSNALYRILQEQLKNILVHSQASAVTVIIKSNDKQVQMIISDNGKGMKYVSKEGIGLSGIRERVQNLKGAVLIDSTPGNGFKMHISIPLKSRKEMAA